MSFSLNIFLGSSDTDKAHIALSTAKILATAGNTVLVVDCSKNQDVYGFFNYSPEETQLSLTEGTLLVRENIDILSDNRRNPNSKPDLETIFNSIDYDGYDYVIAVGEELIPSEMFKYADRLFLVQEQSNNSLEDNNYFLEIFKDVIDISCINVIYNNFLDISFNQDYFLNLLGVPVTSTFITVPSYREDVLLKCSNRLNGTFNLKKYSVPFKNSLYEIINLVSPMSQKRFKLLSNERRA